VEWTVYNFECGDPAGRAALVAWFERAHSIEIPDGSDVVHDTLQGSDGEHSADLAWVTEYLYLLTAARVPGLLADSADRWERAVVATFDSETETCESAVLYHSRGGDPVEEASYEGIEGGNGQGLLYRFAMTHQFRFRAYAHAPPGPMVTPAFGAFEAPVGLGWGSEALADFEHDTGVAPTAAGIEMLADDPVLDEGAFYEESQA
jgi:hypothetical protein